MNVTLELYGSVSSSPYEELAYIGTDDLHLLIKEAVRSFLDNMRDTSEVVFRADMRVTPAAPEYRAGLIPGPLNPERTLHLRGGVSFGRYEDDFLIDTTAVTAAVLSELRMLTVEYIDRPDTVTLDLVMQAEPSDGMHDLPSGWWQAAEEPKEEPEQKPVKVAKKQKAEPV